PDSGGRAGNNTPRKAGGDRRVGILVRVRVGVARYRQRADHVEARPDNIENRPGITLGAGEVWHVFVSGRWSMSKDETTGADREHTEHQTSRDTCAPNPVRPSHGPPQSQSYPRFRRSVSGGAPEIIRSVLSR